MAEHGALALLGRVVYETEQVAREIYYAMTFLDDHHPARANLGLALKLLGVASPTEVGLSNSVLTRRR